MAVTYDFQTPGVSTSAADTQEDIRNIAEASATMYNQSHSLSNIPTNAVRWNTSSKKFELYNGSSWGNLEVANIVGSGGGILSLNAYRTLLLSPIRSQLEIIADSGNTGTTTYDPIVSFYVYTTERARIYTDTNDSHKLKFDVGGSDHMVIDSSGNVGIGTTSSGSPLEVREDGTTTAKVLIRSLSNGDPTISFLSDSKQFTMGIDDTSNAFAISEGSGLGSSDRLVIDSSGNVGIGTSSMVSGSLLTLDGDMALGSTGNALSEIRFFDSSQSGTTRVRTNSDGLVFLTGNANRMVIDSSGNVGIGTSSPQSKIHVWTGNVGGTSPQEAVRIQGDWGGVGSGPLLRFTNEITGGTNPNTNEYNLAGIAAIDDTASWGGSLVFYSAPTGTTGGSNLVERMTIDSSGKVGIGTSSPSSNGLVTIESGDNTTPQLILRTTAGNEQARIHANGSTGELEFYSGDGAGSQTLSLSIDRTNSDVTVSAGNLVIGTSGKGIDFSATSGTGTSELLDDYEEGTFTPTLSTTGTNFTSVTYDGNRSGSYTKIGRTVFFTIFMGTDAITKGSASGGITVAGLPFTSNSTLGVGRSVVKLTASNFLADAPIVGTITENTSYIQLSKRATSVSGDTALQVADIGTGANANFMSISGSYQI